MSRIEELTARNNKIRAKRAILRLIDKEVGALVGRLLSDEEGLRLRSLHDEQDRLENELRDLGVEP